MEKIRRIKYLLKKNGLDGYLIPKNDEFFGEYVSDNKDNLKLISKFSGSYGFALILKKKNYLFVDGRYSLQAKNESGTNFTIVTIPKKMPKDILKRKKILIGFDPKLFTDNSLLRLFSKTKCKLIPVKHNLVEQIKINRKKIKFKKFFFLQDKFSGENLKKKIRKLLNILNAKKIDLQFISAPENVAWLINIRGKDSEYSLLPNSYIILDSRGGIYLFCNYKKIDKNFKNKLKNISILDISSIEKFLRSYKGKKIQIDTNTCSIYFKNIIRQQNFIVEKQDPIYFLKSIKNKTEIKNMIKAHIYDGAALTKFLFWLKNNFKRKKFTELQVQKKLFDFRKNNRSFNSLSFPTISGSGPNGALIHYRANKKSDRTLKDGDIFLLDSGAHYKYGTTDVTRTISLGNTQSRIKNIFTRVLKGHIAVANFKLKKNTSGDEIDYVARKPLKEINLDYAHGTGHGVGYFSNVHEGPQGISRGNKIKLKEGMILSNEPGYYEKGKFGIRIENLIYISKKNEKLNKFENLTLVPIDKSLIEKKLLNKSEIEWINKYHKKVFKSLKKFMNVSELKDLTKACSII